MDAIVHLAALRLQRLAEVPEHLFSQRVQAYSQLNRIRAMLKHLAKGLHL